MKITSMNKREEGFEAVLVLLIVLVVAVVGFGGYYVWNNQQKKTATPTTTSKSTQTTQSTSTTPDSKKSLYVKEWNTSLKYTGDVDLTYTIQAAPSDGFISVGSKELAKVGANCDVTNKTNDGIGTLVRVKPDAVAHISGDFNLTGAEYLAKYPTLAGKLGDYIYIYSPITTEKTCSSSAAGVATIAALKSMFSN